MRVIVRASLWAIFVAVVGVGILILGIGLGQLWEQRKRDISAEQKEFYSQETIIHEAVSSDLVPSIDVKPVPASESKQILIDTKRCFYQLAPYTMRWRNVRDCWEAYLYVPAGMGEAVKEKLETLDFVDGVIIRNSGLYKHPADDRLEIELSQRAGKDHAEMLDAMLPGIMDAVKEGL